MKGNGDIASDGQVLSWPRRVLSADDLRRHLTSQRELLLLPRTIVTPLAADELKARGIRVSWHAPLQKAKPSDDGGWGYGLERPEAAVETALRAVERDGISIVALDVESRAPLEWASAIAATVTQRIGVIAFCGDPALVACVGNKHAGVRAATIASARQAIQARQTLAANLVAVETPGRTFFEIRQIVRAVCDSAAACPADLATALKELDGHAHR